MPFRRVFTRSLFAVAALAAIGGVSGCFSSSAAAVSNGAPSDTVQITLSPTKQRLDIAAGKLTKGAMTIRNTGPQPFSFHVYAAPYNAKSDTDYTPEFTKETHRTQISRWISFAKTAYTLAAGESIDIPYQVTVPASIPAGSQYAAIFAETDGQNTGSVITKKRVGMLVYAKPHGTTASSGNAAFNTISPIVFGSLITSTARVTNTGNTDFDTTVRLEQKTIFGGNTQSSQEERTVLPETTRTINLTTRSLAPVAAYTVTQSATINGKVTSKTTTVYVISPMVAFFVAAFILIISLLGVWRVITKSRTKKQSTTR